MAHGHILLAEDSEDVREIVKGILEDAGFEVECAVDGQAALEAMRASRPDLLITDVSMPRKSGLELLAELRRELAPAVPLVIVCSGFDDAERPAMQLGAACFVRKPFEAGPFLEIVRAVLARRRAERAVLAGESAFAREARARAAAAAAAASRMISASKQTALTLAGSLKRYVQAVARYFDIAPAVVVLVEDGWPVVKAVSDGCPIPTGLRLPGDILYSTGVLAAGTSLVMPDARMLASVVDEYAKMPEVGFLVAVPLLFHRVPVGALALVGAQPRPFAGEDLVILEGLGRHASDQLTHGIQPGSGPGLMTPELFDRVLSTELTLLHGTGGGLELALVEVERPWPATLAPDLAARAGRRLALTGLADGAFAIVKRDLDPAVATQAMSAALSEVLRTVGLRAVGWVSVMDVHLPAVPRQVVLQLAVRALDEARTRPGAPPQRIVLGGRAPTTIEPPASH
jgi:DNA-binding response OmpR family regulator